MATSLINSGKMYPIAGPMDMEAASINALALGSR